MSFLLSAASTHLQTFSLKQQKGEKVFSVPQQNEIISISWMPDATCTAVAYHDHISIYDTAGVLIQNINLLPEQVIYFYLGKGLSVWLQVLSLLVYHRFSFDYI